MTRCLSRSAHWILALAVVGCSASDDRKPVVAADLVSASGTFSPTSGELDVAVSPRDDEGKFAGTTLPDSAFSFANVTMKPQNSSSTPTAIQMHVSGVDVFEADSAKGLTGVVVFDSSGSMSTNDPAAAGRKAGGDAIIDIVKPTDELSIIDFGAGTTSGLGSSRLLQDFTSDHTKLTAALKSLTESGDTPLYGSLLDALDLLDAKTHEPSVIVVLTDGQASDSGLDTVIAQAKAQHVQIYAVGLGSSLSFDELTELGQQTGGGAITATDAKELQSRFAGIGLGVSAGRVVVHGTGTYPALTYTGTYEVAGTLVTDDPAGDAPIRTPFQFLTTVSN
jgi:Mg-chelatase subunit ChlD